MWFWSVRNGNFFSDEDDDDNDEDDNDSKNEPGKSDQKHPKKSAIICTLQEVMPRH